MSCPRKNYLRIRGVKHDVRARTLGEVMRIVWPQLLNSI